MIKFFMKSHRNPEPDFFNGSLFYFSLLFPLLHSIFVHCGLQADLSSDIEEGSGAFYGVSSQYSGTENITISVSTKVCSFGKQVVEKVEVGKLA